MTYLTIPAILAGGFGSRIRDQVDQQQRPKPLLDVDGRPFITFILDTLIDAGYSDVVIMTGFMADTWPKILGNEYNGMNIEYVVEDTPLGTGGAIKKLLETVKDRYDYVLVLNGDTYVENVDYSKFSSDDFTISGIAASDADRYGAISVNDQSLVVSFSEKENVDGQGFINAGNYHFNIQRLIDEMGSSPETFSLEREFLPDLCKRIGVKFLHLDESSFIDIGTYESYEYFRSKK